MCRWRPKPHQRNAKLIESQRKNKLGPRMTSLLQTLYPSFRRNVSHKFVIARRMLQERKWLESEIDILLLNDNAWTSVVIETRTTLAWSSIPRLRGHRDQHGRSVPMLLPPPFTATGYHRPRTRNRKLQVPQPLATTGAEFRTKSCNGSLATQGAMGRDRHV